MEAQIVFALRFESLQAPCRDRSSRSHLCRTVLTARMGMRDISPGI